MYFLSQFVEKDNIFMKLLLLITFILQVIKEVIVIDENFTYIYMSKALHPWPTELREDGQ